MTDPPPLPPQMYSEYGTGVPSKWSKSHPENQRQMTLDDFFVFLYESAIMKNEFAGFRVVDARKIFSRSKLMVDDEQDLNLHTLLSFPDFLEALVRLVCVPAVVTLVVVHTRLPPGEPFAVVFEKLLEYVFDQLYFIDFSTNKLLRKFPSVRNIPAQEQDSIPFAYVRKILGRK
jgi:hypothetical protein